MEFLLFLAFSHLKNFPALQQSYDQNNYGDDQKNVDKSAEGVSRDKTYKPQDKQDD
jgi:hypothetical protein